LAFEGAVRLTPDFRSKNPGIPWTEVISMGNRLVHAHFDVDLDILWKTVIEDLPELISGLERVRQAEEP
jgi:uncharacterized protein with HEPN domain